MNAAFPSGFLVVDKPIGVTSFSVVSLVRRLSGTRRVGHGGTLDPLATGVLPVAVGRATRFIEYLDDVPKVYEARITFGTATDTYDAEGTTTERHDASRLRRSDVEEALPAFIGEIEQRPPAFSALKVAGRPLYSYARAGLAPADVRARTVRVEEVALRSFDAGETAVADVTVVCGKGTYIRSIAHDLGQALETGAHLSALRRTYSGGFGIELARGPEALVDAAERGMLASAMLAVDRAVERRSAAILSAEHARDVRRGKDIRLEGAGATANREGGGICRAYDPEGEFLGILESGSSGGWHPRKVLGG